MSKRAAGVSTKRDMGMAFERSLPSGSEVPTRAELMRVAAESEADLRTVRRVLSGAPARSAAVQKAIEVAWAAELAKREAL